VVPRDVAVDKQVFVCVCVCDGVVQCILISDTRGP
jgi:hypothetical protein